MLQNLNEIGVVLIQPKPIASSLHLLTHTLALIMAHGTDVYSAEAVQEVDRIQEVQAWDEQVLYFTLRQLEEEAEQAKTKAVVTDVVSTLNLHTVFLKLKHADKIMHVATLGLLLEEATENPTAPLYGKDNVLPLDCWVPRNMDANAMAVCSQTLQMTEPQLHDLRTWIYQQYRKNVTMLQICAIMLWWQVARTVDEAFFMARWMSAWSDMPWMQLWANLPSVAMPPRLSDMDQTVLPLPLVVKFQVPLKLCDVTGKSMGDYRLTESGDPQLYLGTFERLPGHIHLRKLDMTQQEWTEWTVLQDIPEEASVSVAELMPETPRELEAGELLDDESATGSSVVSQKQDEVVFDQMGMPIAGCMSLMVDFQLLDYERRHDLRPRDATYQGFSYGLPTFLPK